MKRLVFRGSAAREMEDVRLFYARAGRAGSFDAASDRVLDLIAGFPLMYSVAYANVHRALIKGFPYALFYTVEAEQIVIIGVLHQQRDPASRPKP